MRPACWISLMLVLLIGGPLSAEVPSADRPNSTSARVGDGRPASTAFAEEKGFLARVALGAALLAAGAFGVVLWKRRSVGLGSKAQGQGVLQIVGRAALSPRHFVYVVRVSDRRLVVGVSGDRMVSLGVLDEPAAPRLAPRVETPAPEKRSEPQQRAVTEADLMPYRRQVSRLRELLRGRGADFGSDREAP